MLGELGFTIDDWAAWAPGLPDKAAWDSWFTQPHELPADVTPSLEGFPPMLRRRLDPLGRVALKAAWDCRRGAASSPVVFASRYGELGRSVELLRSLAQGSALSPTSFSLSVHNAIGAVDSIASGSTESYSAIAAGAETVEAAFVEACGLLSEGADEVLVVVYEAPIPSPWAHFAEHADFPHAFACRLRSAPGMTLSCHLDEAPDETSPEALAPDLAVLRFLRSSDERFEHRVGHRRWLWRRHV